MKLNIKKKEWDSSFFGYSIGEVKAECFSSSDFNYILSVAKKQEFELMYLLSTLESQVLLDNGCGLVDTKVIYKRKVVQNLSVDENISLFLKEEDYKELIGLALNSGEYSRFKKDENFRSNEFERLYTEWIKKSVDGSIADAVFSYKLNGQIEGMVTVKFNGEKASIGLIAVKPESRGKSIGKKLIDAINNRAREEGCQYIEVPTQKQNLYACKFYEKAGFSIISTCFIYHLWLKKN